MNGSLRIAKQLVRIARTLVAFDELNRRAGFLGDFGKAFYDVATDDDIFKSNCYGYVLKDGKYIVFKGNSQILNQGRNFSNADEFLTGLEGEIDIIGKFDSEDKAVGFIERECGVNRDRCDAFKVGRLTVKDFTMHLDKSQIEKIIGIVKDKIDGKTKQGVFDKYVSCYTVEFHDYNEESADGENNSFLGTIKIDTNKGCMREDGKFAKPTKILMVLIHEMCHCIIVKNKNVLVKVNEKLKKMQEENKDGIFFRKGDEIEIDGLGTFKALEDFDPTLYKERKTFFNQSRNTRMECVEKNPGTNIPVSEGEEYGWNEISGCGRVKKINGRNVGRRMRSYGLQDSEEFLADNLSEYIMNTRASNQDRVYELVKDIIEEL